MSVKAKVKIMLQARHKREKLALLLFNRPDVLSAMPRWPTVRRSSIEFMSSFLSALLIFFFISNFAIAASSADAQTSANVRLIYSENDRLCKPLATLYNKLNHIHRYEEPEGIRIDVAPHDWEEAYAKDFQRLGLIQPPSIADSQHPFRSEPLRAYYKVDLAGSGQLRMLLLEDIRTGKIEGKLSDFGTNIWLLKPGLEGQTDEDLTEDSTGLITRLKPEVVDLLVPFARGLDGVYPVILTPYLFDKLQSPEERSLPRGERLRRELSIGGDGITIQRLFKFRDEYLFTARELSIGTAFVFKFDPQERMYDICYFASVGTLQFVHQNAGR